MGGGGFGEGAVVDIIGGVGLSKGFRGGTTMGGSGFEDNMTRDSWVEDGLLTCSAARDSAVDSGIVPATGDGFRIAACEGARGTRGFLVGFLGDPSGHLS